MLVKTYKFCVQLLALQLVPQDIDCSMWLLSVGGRVVSRLSNNDRLSNNKD